MPDPRRLAIASGLLGIDPNAAAIRIRAMDGTERQALGALVDWVQDYEAEEARQPARDRQPKERDDE